VGVQGPLGCEERHLVLGEASSKGQPGLQRDPCCSVFVKIALLVCREWFSGGRGNPCCAQSALLGS